MIDMTIKAICRGCGHILTLDQFWYNKINSLKPVREVRCLSCTKATYEKDELTKVRQRFAYYYTALLCIKPVAYYEVQDALKGCDTELTLENWQNILSIVDGLMQKHLDAARYEEITWI